MHILLADDHEVVREGLSAMLRTLDSSAKVTEVGSYPELYAAGRGALPDVVLLDLQMPGLEGTNYGANISAACRAFPGVPVVVISGLSDSATIIDVLQAGARGFVPKTARGGVILMALQMALQGETYVPSTVIPDLVFRPPQRRGGLPPHAELTAREWDTLNLLCEGNSNKQIAQSLGVAETTVKMHLRSLFRKIGAHNRVEAIKIALKEAPRA